VKLLLDTCALLWMGLDASKLSERAQDALAQNGAELFVSAISAFEIGLKFARGKLELPSDPLPWFADALEAYGIVELPMTSEIAVTAACLEWEHRDPADRIVAATALRSGLVVVTSDLALRSFAAVEAVW